MLVRGDVELAVGERVLVGGARLAETARVPEVLQAERVVQEAAAVIVRDDAGGPRRPEVDHGAPEGGRGRREAQRERALVELVGDPRRRQRLQRDVGLAADGLAQAREPAQARVLEIAHGQKDVAAAQHDEHLALREEVHGEREDGPLIAGLADGPARRALPAVGRAGEGARGAEPGGGSSSSGEGVAACLGGGSEVGSSEERVVGGGSDRSGPASSPAFGLVFADFLRNRLSSSADADLDTADPSASACLRPR